MSGYYAVFRRTRCETLTLLLLGLFVSVSTAHADNTHNRKVYIRNQTDQPIRVYFLNAQLDNSFCVKRINERTGALIDQIPKGHWHVAVFELVGQHGMGADGFALVGHADGAIVSVRNTNGVPEVRASLISSP
jgi:hypothetical protein